MHDQEIFVQVLGWVSMTISLVRAIPQIIKIYNTKSGGDVSVLSQVLVMSAGVLWIIYGFLKPDLTVYSTNLVLFLCGLVTLMLKFYYARHSKIPERKPMETRFIELSHHKTAIKQSQDNRN